MTVDSQTRVGPLGYWTGCFRNYATFSGRARRAEYWWFTLFNFLTYVVLFGIGFLVGNTDRSAVWAGVLVLVYTLAAFVPSLAVTCRRLHDAGLNGWWQLLAFIPLGSLAVFVMTLLPGTPGENEYGLNPR